LFEFLLPDQTLVPGSSMHIYINAMYYLLHYLVDIICTFYFF
jgi:hypothetical protein